MAKKTQPVTVDQTPTELTTHKEEFNKVLDERIVIGDEIFNRQITTSEAFNKNRESARTNGVFGLVHTKEHFVFLVKVGFRTI